ncbi:hypothetical protein BU23DRAFT_477919 [Bimuria novae-zelandiae CBS 107.79]|uniref:Uncharacterized protein n=1 Tax=Bimuria novae-zelandiae CBS 107.79 TaxID=1447943 RepID=A0A6A5V743_9PLEO|nr:hypothetical protein BU23DRAFT_477919 [Bimuria novae-zelandiae CBS 107.79]
MYLIDTYTKYAASAVAVCTVLRSICSAIYLAGDPLYRRLGYDWGNSVLAFIALAFFPCAVVSARYGERIRTRFEPRLDSI